VSLILVRFLSHLGWLERVWLASMEIVDGEPLPAAPHAWGAMATDVRESAKVDPSDGTDVPENASTLG
jgi:hypothetical protein